MSLLYARDCRRIMWGVSEGKVASDSNELSGSGGNLFMKDVKNAVHIPRQGTATYPLGNSILLSSS